MDQEFCLDQPACEVLYGDYDSAPQTRRSGIAGIFTDKSLIALLAGDPVGRNWIGKCERPLCLR